MLDHIATKQQINAMVREQKSIQQAHTGKLERALREARRWTVDWQFLASKVSRSKTSWLVADILEPLTLHRSKPERPRQLTVLATDGSQVFPDRHEVASCYLINVGTIAIHYGTGERPLLESRPTLFYKDEDLYSDWGGKRTPVNAEIISTRRGAIELAELASLVSAIPDSSRKAVALSDGTLIFWTLEGKPDDYKQMLLKEILRAFDRLAEARVAVVGYISYPNSADVINALRVGLCPEETVPACEACPQRTYHPNLPPCTVIEGLTDRMLFSRLLREAGDRSVLFRSKSEILSEYGRHRIYFFYINVGYEIARVEIPEWVALDQELLDRVHAAVYDQVEKGMGYPIILAEAHEKAVIRGADRDLFYRLLSDSYVIGGVRSELSRKNIAKRRLMI